ncbi:protein phosphatase 2C 57 isoform X2 [Ricinus communis]|uniref:protein-serine/threonine phosphatase n=1 Tax=Ricinus communis TaxID=3988 RepID=B9T8J0_RICCO|nr:protein phosphatase 2C 57 isoform X2 [Ricinus communis]EEF27824.1 protein phosphatase, putative [Ricinus communis]|eukprot:XP_002534559.1 protein phosphatase 2C 57 isoform X2 [Ricinus communis]
MALFSPQLERFLLSKLHYGSSNFKTTSTKNLNNFVPVRPISQCSAIAIDAPSSLTDVAGVRWGSASLQGAREEMEDYIIVRSDGLDGYSFAGVFDGHGGISSVEFLRDELYKECVAALQGGLLLSGKDFNATRKALTEAFENVDKKLLNWLETIGEEDESGSTATVMFIGNNMLIVSHIGDSCLVLSRSGKAEVLTESHRPYGSNKVSLQEIKRIREAGGWISNGRICGDIAVSRAFGDIRFKTKKNEMLQKGVKEGRWSEKFISRVQFNGDLMTASPDVFQVALGSDAEFIMLASDGLWDYMNSSDAVSFVRNQLRQHGDVQLACEELAQAALDLRSQDNVSIIIADLGQTDWRNLPLQKQNILLEFGQAIATIGVVSLGIWLSSQLSL